MRYWRDLRTYGVNESPILGTNHVARYTIALLLLTMTAATLGCGSKKPSNQVVVQPKTPATNEESAEELTPEVTESTITETAEVPTELPRDPERFLILAKGGPLLLDVWLTVDGRPHDEGLNALIERVLKAADTDDDGRSTWSEWRVNQEFLEGELANLNPVQERRVRNWVKRYDANDDDQMQRTEAAAWLGRDGGRSAKALSLRSSRSYFAATSTNSRLWQLLDSDRDRQLAENEIDRTPQQLFLLDTNDDRILEPSELATLQDQLNAQSPNRMSFANRSKRQAAIYLEDRSEAGQLDYVLSDLYAPRQQLGPTSFSTRAPLFAALDDDDNQSLDSEELASFHAIEPHIKVSLDYTSDAENGNASAKLTLLEHSPEIDQVILPSANRVVLITSDTKLIVSAHDLSASQGADQVVQRNQIRLMVHDRADGLFEELDANADGRLGEREISAAAERLRKCDTNGDRELAEEELTYAMNFVFLRAESSGERSFYVPSFDSALASTSGQESGIPSWFRHADFNSDGDVSRSEFLGSIAQFSKLDTNQDGFISGIEVVVDEAP